MCFLAVIWNYLLIKKQWTQYKNKKNKWKNQEVLEEEEALLKDVEKGLKGCVQTRPNKLKPFLKLLGLTSTTRKLSTPGSLENYLLKSILGFVVGFSLSVYFFYDLIYKGDASLFVTFALRLPLFVIMTTMLAFTEVGRCFFLLTPVHLASKKGEHYIFALITMLVVTGPLANIQHNLIILQETSSCQQKAVYGLASEIADALFGPFAAYRRAAHLIAKGIKEMVDKLQNILRVFKRTVMFVADAIQDAASWLNSKINGCRNSVGTARDYCIKSFSDFFNECKVSVPGFLQYACVAGNYSNVLCEVVKPGEYICDLVHFTVDSLVTTISQRIHRLMDRAYTLLYFDIKIHHVYKIDDNTQVILEDMRDKTNALKPNVNLSVVKDVALFIIFTIIKIRFFVYIWQYMRSYQRRVEFDNYFINRQLTAVDRQGIEDGKGSIFPLRRIEKKKYVRFYNMRLVKKELKVFIESYIAFIEIGVFFLVMLIDYGLYNINEKCREFMLSAYGSLKSKTDVEVVGSGFIADLSQKVLSTLDSMSQDENYSKSLLNCMTPSKPPDVYIRYKIFILTLLFVISITFRPYILRLRHVIMDYYNPNMARRRARWLYNKIVFKRMTFVAMLQIKLKGKQGNVNILSLANMLRARFPWMTRIIGTGLLAEECMICSYVSLGLYKCPTHKCTGVYCDECYKNIYGKCCLCKQPMMHEDFRDLHLDHISSKVVAEDDSNSLDDDRFFVVYDGDEVTLSFEYQVGSAKHSLRPEDKPQSPLESTEEEIHKISVDRSTKRTRARQSSEESKL